MPLKHNYYCGLQVMALCRYLEATAKVHPCVSYHALMQYVDRNHILNGFPLVRGEQARIIGDLGTRRFQTLNLIAEYTHWKTDMSMARKEGKRPSDTEARERWKELSEEIRAIWPKNKGVPTMNVKRVRGW